VITQLQNMLGRLLGEDVELVTNLHTAQCPIHIDPGQLEQVLANLAVNARDAMPNGGCLQIKTRLRDLDAPLEIHGEKADFAPGPHVLLDVIDNGTGMDAQTQKRVFEPFYTTKREGKGTGLGLSTVYGIVQQSGGSIRVQSQPGLGTTFSIAFPLSDQPAPTPPVTKTTSPSGSETLLVVEDEEILRRLMVRILSTGGYEVLTACCGREALQIIETTEVPISLVLSDVVMPEMSGYELARKLHTLHPEIKILFTSGYTTASRPEDKTQVEHTAFIQKPFSTTALLKTIRILLDAD
jgi:CheY-like chemotaxis protein